MTVKLLTEHNLEFQSLKGGRTGSPESTPVKMPHCWKSHVVAQSYNLDPNEMLPYAASHLSLYYLLMYLITGI